MDMTREGTRGATTPAASRGAGNRMSPAREPRFFAKSYDDGYTWDMFAKDAGDIRHVLRDRGWEFMLHDEMFPKEYNVWTMQDIPGAEMWKECDWIFFQGWKVNGKTGEETWE